MKLLTSRIFKNLVKKDVHKPEILSFKDAKVNGRTVGASGFLRYENGVIIYINTEPSCLGEPKILFRKAKNERDFVGDWNNFYPYSSGVAGLLTATRKLAYS